MLIAGLEILVKPRAGTLIAVGVWLLMTVVLVNAYAGTLLSFLSVMKLEPAISSLDELAKSKTCQLIAQAGADLTNNLLVRTIAVKFTVKMYTKINLTKECRKWNLQINWRFFATTPGKCAIQIRSRLSQGQNHKWFLRSYSRPYSMLKT